MKYNHFDVFSSKHIKRLISSATNSINVVNNSRSHANYGSGSVRLSNWLIVLSGARDKLLLLVAAGSHCLVTSDQVISTPSTCNGA